MAKFKPSLFDTLTAANPGLNERAVIRLACEQLLSDAEAEPPIPVERVASLRGIVDIEEADVPYAGMLSPRGPNFVVTVRSSDGYERQRFTICHETGHTLFPGFAERQFRCNGQKTLLEQRCDIAAAELLLPHRFFEADLAAGGFHLSTTEALAKHYHASIEASALRVVDLSKEPAMLLVFRERHKPSERGREHLCEPRLRLDYAHHHGDWPYMRRHKSVAPESAFGRAHSGELVAEISGLDELCSEPLGPVEVHARRYGVDGRVLALVRRPTSTRR